MRILSSLALAIVVSATLACANHSKELKDPATQAKEKRDAQMLKKMQSYVGWNIGSFMSDWGMTPTQTTALPDGNLYQFDKLQSDLSCTWKVRTNNLGNIVQWSMRGNACPNADGP